MNKDDRGILGSIVNFSLHFRWVAVVLAGMLVLYGLFTLTRARYDVFPEFAPPQVVIRTEAPGFSPEQVEALVTIPVESAIAGVEEIESLRSSSLQGLSAITVIFRPESNVYRIRQLVAERIASLTGRLPQGITPFITPLTSSTGDALQIGLTSEKRSLMELRTLADWVVKPRLLSATGVAGVQVFGGDVKQLQVQVRPDLLVRYNLSMDDVVRVARRATGVVGAGFIDNENQRLIVETEGQSLLPGQLAGVVVLQREGANVTLGDLARVTEAPEPPVGAALINGRPGVILLVSSQYGANTLRVTAALDRAVAELRPGLEAEGIALYPDLLRPADFIQTAIHNVLSALLIGAILVVAVLVLFLFNLRTAAISFTAIPLSLLAAIAVMERMGFSINTMILGGLAIAVGEVVDDAVIDVENIYRRLRENRSSANPRPTFRVVLDASVEVRSAVVFATFAVILVFVPILTMSGLAGRFFAPLGVAYILAVSSSLLVALAVTPGLCLLLLGRAKLSAQEPPVVRLLKGRYRRVLGQVERRPRMTAAAVAVLIIIGLVAFPFLSAEFLPELWGGDFTVHMVTVPGTSLEESTRLGRRVAQELFKLPDVRAVSQKAGRATRGSSVRGTNMSEINVAPRRVEGEEAVFSGKQVRSMLASFPGADFSVTSFLTERIEETVSGYTAPVAVKIFGDDLDVLFRKGREIAGILKTVPGAADIMVQSTPGAPGIIVGLDREALAQWGFDPVEALDAVGTAYQGSIVGQIYEKNRAFNVNVILDPADRASSSALRRLPLRSPSGVYIPLDRLASVYETSGPSVILHEGARRVQTVTCNVTGRSVPSFVDEARRRILAELALPPGTYLEFGGTAEEQARAKSELILHSLLAGIGIVLLLWVVLGNLRNLFLVLVNIPFALVGSVLAVLASGGLLSLGAMVGFVTVFGITLRNSIMVISHYEHLVKFEGMSWSSEAASRGASERLAPILMTALVTGLGLLPLAIGANAAGREIEGPMAVAILGGLVTSTALNLLVLPSLALKYGRFRSNTGGTGSPG